MFRAPDFAAGFLLAWLLAWWRARAQGQAAPRKGLRAGPDSDGELSEDDSDAGEGVRDVDGLDFGPHKMLLCVRTDLKMGKGKIAAQCGHATLGAYKAAKRSAPNALKGWETIGQAKICTKVSSEEQLMEVRQRAIDAGLNTYVVVDAGRTQIAPNSRTVLAIGPAPEAQFAGVTDDLKLM